MQFPAKPRRRPVEAIVPMINVVFLLLIFFMMSSQIAPPAPFEVALPAAQSDSALPEDITLYLAADGSLALGELSGEQVWAALSDHQSVTLKADAEMPAVRLADTMKRLAAAGIETINIAVDPQ